MSAILEIPTLPRSLIFNLPLTDEEFETLCLACENAQLGRTKGGGIELNPPVAVFPAMQTAKSLINSGHGGIHTNVGGFLISSAGFFLPDGSVLGPDAAYIRKGKSRANH